MVTTVNNSVYLKFAKRVYLNCSYHTQKKIGRKEERKRERGREGRLEDNSNYVR